MKKVRGNSVFMNLCVVWVKAQNTAKEKPNISEQMTQVVIADGDAGGLAKSGGETHGCDFH